MEIVRLELEDRFNTLVEKWANTLEANIDDFVNVDGEEGDFGIVRYFGFDVDGNANVHMMTRYVYGGDHTDTYYTPAGCDMVQKILRQNFETVVRRQLEQSLDPGHSTDGMYPGFVADYEKAVQMAQASGKEIKCELGTDLQHFIPTDAEHGDIFKWGFRLFRLFVMRPTDETAPTKFGLRNIFAPTQFMALRRKQKPGKAHDEAFFLLSAADWFTIYQENRISLVEIDRSQLPDSPSRFPFTATIERVIL